MANTLVVAPDFYSKPAKTATPGARADFRTIALTTAQMITTNIFTLGILPAGHRLSSYFIESDAFETASYSGTLTVGILNTYYNQAPAAAATPANYNNATGTTESPSTQADVRTTPSLVTGHNLVTASTIVQAGGRLTGPYPLTLTPAYSIGVDTKNDRIIVAQFAAAPATGAGTTSVAGNLSFGWTIDYD